MPPPPWTAPTPAPPPVGSTATIPPPALHPPHAATRSRPTPSAGSAPGPATGRPPVGRRTVSKRGYQMQPWRNNVAHPANLETEKFLASKSPPTKVCHLERLVTLLPI